MFSLLSMPSSNPWLDSAGQRLHRASASWASGRRVNSAADNPAVLAISERLASQIQGEQVARAGTMDGLSLAETADGALSQVGQDLQRMRELALQSRNGTLSNSDRVSLNTEYQQLGQEINRIAGGTTFNGQHILAADSGTHHINAGAGANDTVDVSTPDLRQDTHLQDAAAGDISTAGGSSSMLDAIDKAVDSLGQARAGLGAAQNRLQAVADAEALHVETGSAVYGRIMDADPAQTAAEWRMAQVQQYAAMSMTRSNTWSTRQLLSLFA